MSTLQPINLSISEKLTVAEIQQFFSGTYNFLKIEFYKTLELNGIRITKKIENHSLLPKAAMPSIDLSHFRTVEQIKADFQRATGLIARVFRKSGNVWIETSLTDDWSLERQNAEGKLIEQTQ
ncbi:MAG: hypothetical protein FJZ78_08750 [Bacteroidetes bacterium]|nr:hypothetical protein [Bacteroidota bacterium]